MEIEKQTEKQTEKQIEDNKILVKTLSMRISFIMMEMWDKVNEYDVEAERQSKYSNQKALRRFYADDVRKLTTRLQREINEINYIEVR